MRWQQLWLTVLLVAFTLLSLETVDEAAAETLNVTDLGFNGTWDEFCDYDEIEKEFAGFLDHDVKFIRVLICRLRGQNQIFLQTMPALVSYKYCASIRANLEDLYLRLIQKFDLKNHTEITGELALAVKNNQTSECIQSSMEVFHRECIKEQNPCLRMFRTILRIACTLPRISEDDISRNLEEVCKGKFISDDIDLIRLMGSIKLTEN